MEITSHRRPLDPDLRAQLISDIQDYREMFRKVRAKAPHEEFVRFRAGIMACHRKYRRQVVELERVFHASLAKDIDSITRGDGNRVH